MKRDWALKHAWILAFLIAALIAVSGHFDPSPPATVEAASQAIPWAGYIWDTPTITIANGTATTTATPSAGVYRAQIVWKFGTVSGSYGTCTVQALTSYDGTNFEALGSAASITVATGEYNVWDIYGKAPDTVATVTTPSAGTTSTSLSVNSFGFFTEYVFACGAGYGTSAPVRISVIYK
jgi:hypothetical protein